MLINMLTCKVIRHDNQCTLLFATMIVTRRFSLTNFAIATSALCFQVFVLYPWHKQLDKNFQELKNEHLRILRGGEEARMAELKEIREGLSGLKQIKSRRS